jgi:1-acyl-sn-glycerol-3-phosphate acyltransferase
MLRIPITILTTIVGVVGQGLMTFFVASYVIVLIRIRPNAKQVPRVLRFWAKSFLFFTRTRVTVAGADLIDPSGSYVVVANHTSNLDIPAIMGKLPVSVRFLAKRELFKVPVLGSAMAGVHMIETDRRAGPAAHRAINEQVATVIGAGLSVMIFPEGTRSESGEMLPFKKGAFRIAVDNEMPVIPVTIIGAREAWKPHSKLIRGGKVRLVIHEPIPTVGLDRKDLDGLRDRVHRIVAAPQGERSESQ